MRFRFNEAAIIIVAFIFIIPLLLGKSSIVFIAMLIISQLFLLLHGKPNSGLFLKLFLLLMIPTISVFITAIVNTADKEQSEVVYRIANYPIYKLAFDNAIHLTLRSFCMSIISLTYVTSIKYNKLVLSLMQNFKMHTNIGYSLLAAFNAFYHLKSEFYRIKLINKFRSGKNVNSIKMLFPLLVSAGRYSSQAGLSLASRGLNKDKTFLIEVKWRITDTLLISIAILSTIAILLLF